MNKKILIWIIVSLVLINGVLALGIRPAKTTAKPYTNIPQLFSIRIVNNDHNLMDVDVYAEGDLAKYIRFDETRIHFEESDDMKQVKFKLELPYEVKPGSHVIHIVAEEQLPDMEVSGNMFMAKLKIIHKVYVDIPYPDKFLDAKIDYKEDEKQIKFSISAKNVGSKDISKAESVIGVYEDSREVVRAETGEESIKQGEKKTLNAEIDKDAVGNGEFDLVAKIFFDQEILELTRAMMVGMPYIEIVNFDKFFEIGKVNKLDIDLINKWNKDLNSSYVEVFVFKEDEKVIGIKSVTFDLKKKESRRITSYLDAKNLALGEYDATVVVHYGEYSTTKQEKINIVSADEYEKLQKSTGWIYLIAVLVVVIVVLLVLILELAKRKKAKG